MFRRFTSRQLGLSQPTPPMSATLNRATNTNDAGSPQIMESVFLRKLFLHALLHCCEWPVLRQKAMLGPPLHNGLYCMAWTVLAVWR